MTATAALPTVCGQPYRPDSYNTLHINGCQVSINARYTDDDPGRSFVYELRVSHRTYTGPDHCARHNVPADKLERLVTELTTHLVARTARRRPVRLHGFDDDGGPGFAVIRDATADPDTFAALAWAYMIDEEVGQGCAIQPPRWTTYRCEQSYHNGEEYRWLLTERPPGRGVFTGAIAALSYHPEWTPRWDAPDEQP